MPFYVKVMQSHGATTLPPLVPTVMKDGSVGTLTRNVAESSLDSANRSLLQLRVTKYQAFS